MLHRLKILFLSYLMFAKAANYFGKQIIRNPVDNFKNGLLYRYIKKKPLELNFGPKSKAIYTIGEPSTPKRKYNEPLTPPKSNKRQKIDIMPKFKSYKKKSYRGNRKKYNKRGKKRQASYNKKGLKKYTVKKKSMKYNVILRYKQPKGVKVAKALMQNWEVTRQVTFANAPQSGRQEANEITSPPFNNSDIINCYNRAARFYDYGTGSWIASNESTGGGHLTVDGGKKFFMKSCEATYNFTNQGPTSAYVTMYFLIPKKTDDTATDPLALWDLGYTTQALNTTIKTKSWIDSRPTESKFFNFAYTIFNKKQFKMDPGGEAKLECLFNINRYIDTDYCNKYLTMKGITIRTLLVVHGVVADSAKTIAAGTVTTAPAKIVGICTYKYKGHLGTTFPSSRTFIGSQLTNYAPGVVDQIWSIVDASGAVVDPNKNDNYA